MVDCAKNLYEILNVQNNAGADEIKHAYKRLVRIYHPDINKSKDAEIKFKLLNNAYEILSDEIKRKNYDALLNISKSDFKKSEISNYEFRKNYKPPKNRITPDSESVIKEVVITSDEALFGTTRTVNILNKQICPRCSGKKFINGIKCSFCLGEGEKKELRQIDVEIEKNIKEGDFIYVDKVNSSALYDKKLFLKIKIEFPKKLYFEDGDIFVRVEVPYYDCILGTKKEINIDKTGLVQFEIPPMTKPNSRIKLDLKGRKENYYAQIETIFPNQISIEEKRLYQKIKELNG